MGNLVFIESGRKRIGEWARCKGCNKKFVRRASGTNGVRKFCRKSCSSSHARTGIKHRCSTCSADIVRVPSRIRTNKSGLFFCSSACMAIAQRIEGGDPRIHPNHYGTGRRNYKGIAFRNHPNECVDCGLAFLPLSVVHHKDGNRENNKPSNLEVVCQNHHIARHMKFVSGIGWVYCTSVLTPRSRLPEVFLLIAGT